MEQRVLAHAILPNKASKLPGKNTYDHLPPYRVKLWYPAPWVGNTNVPHSAERKGELACVSRFLTYVMASSRMGDHGRTHKGQANEICARGVRIFCRCMRPPKS